MKKLIILLFVLIPFSASSSASMMFDFTIDDLGGFNSNTSIGDSFGFTFFDDSNFATGITAADFESISYDTNFLGQASWSVAPCANCSALALSEIFSFTDLGASAWQLDLLIGVTGQDVAFSDGTAGLAHTLQLGQTDDGNGPTNLNISGEAGSQFVHYFSGNHTLSAQTTSVPTPATLALFGIGLAGLGWSKRKKA